jgi:nitroreductase
VGAGPGGLAVTSGPDSQRGAAVLEAIRSRRVVRAMTAEPVGREALETLLDAARWAPTAGNRHLQRFVATDDLATLRVLRAVSPGMLQRPTAAITICTDRAAAAGYGFPPGAPGLFVDVGTAMATLLLAAHAIGVGAGPVTSFSRAAVAVVLQLPEGWRPELIVCLGHPAPDTRRPMRGRAGLTWRDLTTWVPPECPTADSPEPSGQDRGPGTPPTQTSGPSRA